MILLSIIFWWSSLSWASCGEGLGFKDLTDHSLTTSAATQTLAARREIASLRTANARASFLPRLSLQTNHGLSDDLPARRDGVAPYVSNATLSLTQPLYDNGLSLLQLENSRLQEKVTELERQESEEQLYLDIARLYLHYSERCAVLSVLSKQKQVMKRQYQLAGNVYKQGFMPRRDYLKFQIESQRNELQAEDLAQQVLDAQIELLKAAGYENEQWNKTEVKPHAIDLAALGNGSVEKSAVSSTSIISRRQDLLRLQHEMNQLEKQRASKRVLPEINLSSQLQYGSSNYLGTKDTFTDHDRTQWSVLLGVNWVLWDFQTLQRESQIIAQEARIRDLNAQEDIRKLQLQQDKQERHLKQLRQNFSMQERLLRLAQETFSETESNYRAGQIPMTTYLERLADLLAAETSTIQAFFQKKILEAENSFYEGRGRETLEH